MAFTEQSLHSFFVFICTKQMPINSKIFETTKSKKIYICVIPLLFVYSVIEVIKKNINKFKWDFLYKNPSIESQW